MCKLAPFFSYLYSPKRKGIKRKWSGERALWTASYDNPGVQDEAKKEQMKTQRLANGAEQEDRLVNKRHDNCIKKGKIKVISPRKRVEEGRTCQSEARTEGEPAEPWISAERQHPGCHNEGRMKAMPVKAREIGSVCCQSKKGNKLGLTEQLSSPYHRVGHSGSAGFLHSLYCAVGLRCDGLSWRRLGSVPVNDGLKEGLQPVVGFWEQEPLVPIWESLFTLDPHGTDWSPFKGMCIEHCFINLLFTLDKIYVCSLML